MIGESRQPQRIAVGVDGSLASHAAICWAIDHARSGDTVHLTHAFEPSPATVDRGTLAASDGASQSLLRREMARARNLAGARNVRVTGEVVRGDPGDRLREISADLLVVGSRGQGRLARALTGSVVGHLTHHTDVPIVIVPARRPGRPSRVDVPGPTS